MKVVKVVVSLVAVAAIAATGFAYSGLYDVSASSPHSGLVDWLLSTTSRASVNRHAVGVQVPDLDDAMALAGVSDFDAMCTGCHGAPGQEPAAMGQGLNPPAPDLARAATELTPAEIFWVTKNGIKMTGMPSWGATHDDSAIWPVVAFIGRLPGLDADQYQMMLANAQGQGHHAVAAPASAHSHAETSTGIGFDQHAQPDDHGDATDSDVADPNKSELESDPNDHSSHTH